MDFGHLLCCCLFLLNSYMATASDVSRDAVTGSLQEFHKLPCNITRGYRGREVNLFCPSMDLQQFTVEIKLGEVVQIICIAEDVNLTSINVNIGPIDGFISKRCNLVNQFRRIFELWRIEATKRWDINGYSDRDFVLRRNEFLNLDVSEVANVRIEKSNIIEIELDTFYDFASLKTISLKSNKLKVLPDLFEHCKFVRLMELADNHLESLPEKITAPSLTIIQLWKNNLTRLNGSLFSRAPALKVIEFSKNKIELLPESLLYSVPNLEAFSLLGNNVSEVPENFFKMNRNLLDIRLSGLNMSTVPENLFQDLENLTQIMLQANALEILPEKLFYGLHKLKDLYLNENKLKHLSKTVFKDLESLQFLDLSENELTEWSYDISVNLKSLVTLQLSGNNFQTIGSDYFYSLRSLEYLFLDNNEISYINVSAFNHLKLEQLDLSRNNLTDTKDLVSFIDGLMMATKLFLDWNQFETLPNNIQVKTRYLHMSHNNIKEIQMTDLTSLVEAHFNDNQIEVLNFGYLDTIYSVPDIDLGSKVTLYVGDNPIQCGCSAYNLIQFLDKTYPYKKIYDQFSLIGQIKCDGPSDSVGKDVRQLKSEEFTCDYAQFYACPERCSCSMYPKYKSFNVSCRDSGLDVAPKISSFVPINFSQVFYINRLVVDLSNNSISNFTEKDAGYANATELYLSKNELDLVNWLPRKLEVLELNDNRLQNLDYRAISVLNNSKILKRLTLNDNNWQCDCKLLNLTRLIKWKILQIPGDSEILCSDGRKVILMTEGVLCVLENQAALIAIGVCFFLFLIMIGVALVFYYKYEYHVKVWLYSKPLFMRFVAEEDLDKDKIYDAFLSYANDDEEVVKELISELEGGPEAYKLCVHTRDWIVGEFIIKQIADSVMNSRRTIVVLSPRFLESEWATTEFRTAHTQAMKEGRHRLIVILYGDIDPNTIKDEDLRTYLSTNTYVKWGDPWFWKKLRYVLPHKRNEFTNNNNHHGDAKTRRSKNSRKMENIMVTIDKMDLINSPVTPNLGTPPAVSLDPLLLKSDRNTLEFRSAPNNETPPAEGKLITTANGR